MSGSRLASVAASSMLSAAKKSKLVSPIPPASTFTTTTLQFSPTTSTSGAYYQEPSKVPMGVTGVAATISAGLLLGAAISKNMASFLEENELFVVSDDDDDD